MLLVMVIVPPVSTASPHRSTSNRASSGINRSTTQIVGATAATYSTTIMALPCWVGLTESVMVKDPAVSSRSS